MEDFCLGYQLGNNYISKLYIRLPVGEPDINALHDVPECL